MTEAGILYGSVAGDGARNLDETVFLRTLCTVLKCLWMLS